MKGKSSQNRRKSLRSIKMTTDGRGTRLQYPLLKTNTCEHSFDSRFIDCDSGKPVENPSQSANRNLGSKCNERHSND